MHDSVPHCQIIKKQIPLQKGKIFLLPWLKKDFSLYWSLFK
jgi:hypothetical protein